MTDWVFILSNHTYIKLCKHQVETGIVKMSTNDRQTMISEHTAIKEEFDCAHESTMPFGTEKNVISTGTVNME